MTPDLFSIPYAKGSRTSLEGAIAAIPRKASQEQRILAHIERMGAYGATNCELKQATGIKESSTMSARINTLMKHGKIKDSGMERKSIYNVNQVAWVRV